MTKKNSDGIHEEMEALFREITTQASAPSSLFGNNRDFGTRILSVEEERKMRIREYLELNYSISDAESYADRDLE